MTTIALIILAAGASRRFGTDNKLLAPIEGEPLIVRTIRRIGTASIPGVALELTVVVRDGDGVARALAGIALRLVINPRADEGMGTSIAAGIASLGPGVDAALIVPGDLPFISAALLEQLIKAFTADGGTRATHPLLVDGTRVGPVVWPKRLFGALMALEGEAGGRSLLNIEATVGVALAEAALLADIDTPADLERLVGKQV